MASRDFVGVDLIAAMQQHCKRFLAVRLAQPRPHRVALRPFTLQVADLFTVARHKRDPQIVVQIASY